jgi:hypothetical protein
MAASSEYQFPIFISSTDYNLVDLRAELDRYLYELNYRPILSSSDGFPDRSPDLEPWESCLPVLMNCFVIVVIIDGRYGKTLEWPNYKKELGNRKLSPTHAEYKYAHKHGKRMLVFIRSNVYHHYQSYRTTLKNTNGDRKEARKLLKKTLPKNIEFETLQFIEEVKTTSPIPWIKEFNNVTSIKEDVHKKMLNELAEIFLVRQKHLEVVTRAFSEAIKKLEPEERQELLRNVGATDELINEIERRAYRVNELKTEEKELQAKLDTAKTELRTSKVLSKEKKELEAEIKNLASKINRLEKDIAIQESYSSPFFTVDPSINIDDRIHGFKPLTITPSLGSTEIFSPIGQDKPFSEVNMFGTECTLCKKNSIFQHKCSHCHRIFCNDCWPEGSGTIIDINNVYPIETPLCPKCK